MNNSIQPSGAGRALRHTAVVLSLLLWAGTGAVAQVSIGVSMPGVSIGINMPVYPQFVRVPNYPVYYAPRLQTNFFFYDGVYWVYQRDNWYASSWYNGPWRLVNPQAVPLYVLRVPVRYYRNPPTYFRGWRSDAPPRWGEHWGNEWSQQKKRVGPLGPARRTGAGTAADLSKAVFRESLSPGRAAAGLAEPQLPLPTAGRSRATAISAVRRRRRRLCRLNACSRRRPSGLPTCKAALPCRTGRSSSRVPSAASLNRHRCNSRSRCRCSRRNSISKASSGASLRHPARTTGAHLRAAPPHPGRSRAKGKARARDKAGDTTRPRARSTTATMNATRVGKARSSPA